VEPQSQTVPMYEGTVRNPQGDAMIAAARKDLSDEDFNALMHETGGKAPTAAQLVKLVEARRNVHRA
jgi:hypothetical protein